MALVVHPKFSAAKPEEKGKPFNKIMIVGEATNTQDEKAGRPFSGNVGKELDAMLAMAGIERDECYITHVFWRKPPRGQIGEMCGKKAEVAKSYKENREVLVRNCPDFLWPATYTWGALARGKYLKPERLPSLLRLQAEIEEVKPNIIIAMGNTASWALTGQTGIARNRGTVLASTLVPSAKVMPTYHPTAVIRDWSLRPICVADIMKAFRQRDVPEIIVPNKRIHIEPTIEELEKFADEYTHVEMHGVDVETEKKLITCIGFSPTPDYAFVVPLWDKTKPRWSYWPDAATEVRAMKAIRKLLAGSAGKVFQNGLYDLQYIWETLCCPVLGPNEDTMLMHHALQPEMPKGLGFLGSVYTDNPSWKHLRTFKPDNEKKDE